MKSRFPAILIAITLSGCTSAFNVKNAETQANAGAISLGGTQLESIRIDKPGLFPEDIKYNPITDKFIVGSFREGAVYEVGLDGAYRKLIDDPLLNSALGIQIDTERNRLLVVNADLGASIHPYPAGPKKAASLGIYELSSGKAINFVDLGKLKPNGAHLANGITMDDEGNAYITDSFSPVIYKVDTQGHASVFLESDRFLGEGINLNGIVFHPDGYLIAVKKGEGVLFKIPLNKPQDFSEIELTTKFIGGDGLVLVGKNELVVIANRASGKVTETVFSVRSDDNWNSAKVTDEYKFGKVYLTTGAIRKDKLYVLHSDLVSLMQAPQDQKDKLLTKATIQQVAIIRP
jgi:hypothetical protein